MDAVQFLNYYNVRRTRLQCYPNFSYYVCKFDGNDSKIFYHDPLEEYQ